MHGVTLFVRSYPPDFGWLNYSVQSMKKYMTGVKYKLLVVPANTQIPDNIRSFFDYVVESFMYDKYPGYIAQQFDKLDAYRYVRTDYVLYSDSDCIYTGPFDAQSMFENGKPILGMTPYQELQGSDGYKWKLITETLLNYQVDFEFMRCLPLMHRKETLQELSYDIPNLPRKIVGHDLSEFNLLGAYAFMKQHPYKFTIEVPRYPCKQYWSWGGLTTEIQQEIEACCSSPNTQTPTNNS